MPANNFGNREVHSQVSKILLILLSALLFFFKLGDFSLYDAAETTYGEFVKQILLTGDWLTLHFNGQIIFDKPPLYYWLVAALSKLIGFSEFTMRFWAALAGVLTVITTYALGKSFHNERTGFLSGIITLTSFQFLIQSRIAELDIVLTLFITLSLYLWHLWYKSGNKTFVLLAYLPLGLGMLIKGLLAVALPACAVFLFLLIRGELRKIVEMRPVAGSLIITAVGLPWYIAEYLLHGKAFLDFALGFLFLSRFQGVVSGHTGPWYYYFIAVLLGFAPWSQFLPYTLLKTFNDSRLKTQTPALLSLCFILPAFLVFSVAQTKIPNYILPIYPFLAIMVGKLWDELFSGNLRLNVAVSRSSILSLVIVILIITGVTIAGQNYAGPYQALIPNLLILGIVLTAGTLCSVFYALRSNYKFSFYSLPIMVAIIVFLLTTQTLPAVEKFKGEKELGQLVTKVIKLNEKIAAFNIGNRPGVVFYNSRTVAFLSREAEAVEFLRNRRGYCFTEITNLEALLKHSRLLAKQGDLAVLY